MPPKRKVTQYTPIGVGSSDPSFDHSAALTALFNKTHGDLGKMVPIEVEVEDDDDDEDNDMEKEDAVIVISSDDEKPPRPTPAKTPARMPVPQRKSKTAIPKKPEKKSPSTDRCMLALSASADGLQQMGTELAKSREKTVLARLEARRQIRAAKYQAQAQKHQHDLAAQEQKRQHDLAAQEQRRQHDLAAQAQAHELRLQEKQYRFEAQMTIYRELIKTWIACGREGSEPTPPKWD